MAIQHGDSHSAYPAASLSRGQEGRNVPPGALAAGVPRPPGIYAPCSDRPCGWGELNPGGAEWLQAARPGDFW